MSLGNWKGPLRGRSVQEWDSLPGGDTPHHLCDFGKDPAWAEGQWARRASGVFEIMAVSLSFFIDQIVHE